MVNDLSATKQALLAIKTLQAKLKALESAHEKLLYEPIAVVGMSCRLPGKADSPESFWQLLQRKGDAIAPTPKDRWPIEKYYDADAAAPGKMVSAEGGFIPHLYDFDAAFFRISPREAVSLDPQQRLALELGWEALEHAAIAPDSLAEGTGKSTGEFLGISSIDHWQQVLAQPTDSIDAYLATGNTHSVAAGRLSYLLGVNGPSLAIDTACSSSLVAVHLACQSLRQQACDAALAGGVNRILTPAASINFSKANMLAADGRCRTFDQAASGFGRAEGGGMVVLKRLSDAQAAGDRIHAVILGSATNHNGRTNGLTAPSRTAQVTVIRQALAASRIEPVAVSYVETHGTGTALGDPIEIGALGDVFGERKGPVVPVVLGAVKTNIGHAEAAAGVAGLIKAVLAIDKLQIPANLHLDQPNSHIAWNDLPFQLPVESMPWPSTDTAPTAGVSAFGFSGTNAHLILQSPPSEAGVDSNIYGQRSAAEKSYLFPLSARSPAALNQLSARYAQYLAAYAEVDLADVCYTAGVGRSHFSCRLAIVVTSTAELRQSLIDTLAGRSPSNGWSNCWQSAERLQTMGSAEAIPEKLKACAIAYVQGERVDWSALYSAGQYRKLALPTYPFQRQYYGPATAGPTAAAEK